MIFAMNSNALRQEGNKNRALAGASKIDRRKNPVENVSGYRQVRG